MNSLSNERIIKGTVTPLSGLVADKNSNSIFTYAWAGDCEATASIYELDVFGRKASSPIASTALNTLAQFELIVPRVPNSTGVTHIIEVTGTGLPICEQVFIRPLAGDLNNQDVGYSSSVLGFGLDINLPVNFTQARASEVAQLISLLPNTSLMDAYNFLITNPAAKAKFESLFGVSPSVLKDSVPKILEYNIPQILSERETKQYSVLSSHWNPDYQISYLWKLNGKKVSKDATWTFTPDADFDGVQSLDLYIGADNGSGAIDTDKSYYHKNFTIMVLNSFPATAPVISVPAEFTGNGSVMVSIDTGLAKINCDSFQSMAITVNNPDAPSSFPFTCSSEISQDQQVVLQGEGLKTIRLWVKDRKGRISEAPTVALITLDQAPPVISMNLSESTVRGGGRNYITFNATDISGISTIALYFAEDGTNYNLVENILISSSPYPFLVPQVDKSNAKFKLVATDGVGNSSDLISDSFSILSTPPIAGTLSLLSDAITNSKDVSLALSTCDGTNQILINEGSTPDIHSGGWTSCSNFLNYSLTNENQGIRPIHIWARDIVDNIAIGNHVTVHYDTVTPPSPQLQLVTPQVSKFALIKYKVQNCNDTNKIIISSTSPGLNEPDWMNCDTSIEYSAQTSNDDGVKTINVWAKDLAGNISSATSLLSMTLDQTPPHLTINPPPSVVKGGNTLNVSFTANDSSGLESLKLYYSEDGINYSLLGNLSTNAINYNLVAPLVDKVGVRLKLEAIDKADNKSEVISSPFSILSTPPSVGLLSLTSLAITNSSLIGLSLDNCTGVDKILINEGANPNVESGDWVTCSTNLTYNLSGNSQGQRSIKLWAKDVVNNFSASNSVTVFYDSVPPIAPALQLLTPSFTNSNNSRFKVLNCTDTQEIIVLTTGTPVLNDSDWKNCNTSTEYPVELSSGDEQKIFRIWGKDSAGNISENGSILSMTLDLTPPTLTIYFSPAVVKGGNTVNISFTTHDSSGLESLKLYSSEDGIVYSLLSNLAVNVTSYNLVAPMVDKVGFRLKLEATDRAGNKAEMISSPLTIISTPPVIGTLSLSSLTITNSSLINLSLPHCIGIDKILINEGANPNVESGDWVTCSTNLTYNLSGNTQGLRSIKLWAKDVVNNYSSSNSVSIFYDSLPPNSPILLYTTPTLTNANEARFKVANCTDTQKIIVVSSGTPNLNDSNWKDCNTLTEYPVLLSSGDGQKQFRVWAKDEAGNISSSGSLFSVILDQTPPTFHGVTINSTSDFPQGEYSTGLSLVNVKVNVSDQNPGVKIRLSNADNSNNCVQSDSQWISHTAGPQGSDQVYSWYLTFSDGTQKVCVWAKDDVGNETIVSSAGTAGIDMDTIVFETGNIPTVKSFIVTNSSSSDSTLVGSTNFLAGDTATISWTVTDVEGLSNTPISIEMTTDNTNWTTLVSNYGTLTGNPTTYSGSYDYTSTRAYNNATVANRYFRFRLRATDKTGNTSVAIQSQALNLNNWSIFAGSNDRGIGGTSKSASLSAYGLGKMGFAVNPTTNDIYALDLEGSAIVKISSSTGIVTKFLTIGTTLNLSGTGGALPATPTIRISNNNGAFTFDNNGYFYVLTATTLSQGAIYQIDLIKNTSRIYVGQSSGTAEGLTAAQTNINVSSPFVFDSYNNLYFFATCDPTISVGYTANGGAAAANTIKLMKASQVVSTNVYSGGTTTHLAGNCVRGNQSFGNDAHLSPIYSDLPLYIKIAVNEDGSQIYVLPYSAPAAFFKIINGILYSTSSMSSFELAFNKKNSKFYTHNSGQIYEFSAVNGNGGETFTTYMGTSSTTGDCVADAIHHSQACIQTSNHMEFTKDGTLLIGDGMKGSTLTKYRIRYKDENGLMRTLAGVNSFNADGIKKDLINGTFSSIHYKKSTDPNLTDNPEGLYFISTDSNIYGRIEASSHSTNPDQVKIIWGNQVVGANSQKADGTLVSKNESLYNFVNMKFDENGYPWIFYNISTLTKLVGEVSYRKLRSSGSTTYWDSTGATIANSGLYSNGGSWIPFNNNIVALGKTCTSSQITGGTCTDAPRGISKVRYIDFLNNTISTLFGGASNTWTNDISSYGGLTNMTFHIETNLGKIEPAFGSTPAKLYYVENRSYLRYIEDPLNPANSRLKTLLNISSMYGYTLNPSGGIYPQNSMIFVIKGATTAAQLYCYANPEVSGAPTWCNGTSLGPNGPSVDLAYLSSATASNTSLTWKDGNKLLINADTMIFQYDIR